jgi:TetR/AcrR family transcriptional repressor of nem operon
MTATEERARRLTPKGLATRDRIVDAAAELIYSRGVHATNNELVRKAAGVSGSQLSHYFPDKESLVRAVIELRADSMIGLGGTRPRGPFDSLAALRGWADFYLERENVVIGGCLFGSLASEIMKTELNVRDEIAAGFERWRAVFRDGFQTMRDRGDLRPDADPDHLAGALAAAFQGGMLLSQAERNIAPLRDGLESALAYIASFAPAKTKS